MPSPADLKTRRAAKFTEILLLKDGTWHGQSQSQKPDCDLGCIICFTQSLSFIWKSLNYWKSLANVILRACTFTCQYSRPRCRAINSLIIPFISAITPTRSLCRTPALRTNAHGSGRSSISRPIEIRYVSVDFSERIVSHLHCWSHWSLVHNLILKPYIAIYKSCKHPRITCIV